MGHKRKITSLDIADLAGVSQATVSRALRGSPLVSDETRQRVEAAALQLNYTVDKNASNLRSQHAGTLALLIFEDPTADDSYINPFFLSMLGSITHACAVQGYDLLISFQQLSHDWHADYADSKKADAILLLGYGDYLTHAHKLVQLQQQGTHSVRWGVVLDDQPDVSIGSDNVRGGELATAHLIDQGCRRIAFIGLASSHYPEFFARFRGYAAALERAGITPDPRLQADAESTEQAGFDAAHALLVAGLTFDAVLAASDLIAIGVMRALAESQLRVPGDVAVAGFDDIPTARLVNPPLTTVMQDTKAAGAMLVDAALGLIRGNAVASEVLPVQLVVRGSSLRRTGRG